MAKPDRRLELALRHAAAAKEAKETSATEKSLRAELVAACFPKLEFGTNTCDLGGGYVVKAEVRPNPKLDAGLVATALGAMRKSGKLGRELAARLVRHKPELMLGEWKKLPEALRALFPAGAVTIEAGTPSVELKQPPA